MRALKWGEEVVPDTPYDPSIEILDQYNCQFYIHGDDPVIINGVNINDVMKELGRFKEVRRTTGVSTTDLTGKLLKLIEPDEEEKSNGPTSQLVVDPPKQTFLQTSTRIAQFSNRREPKVDDTIVYF